jgi:hypothetical protein
MVSDYTEDSLFNGHGAPTLVAPADFKLNNVEAGLSGPLARAGTPRR